MQIYFVRHGPNETRDQWNGDDFDRPLTDTGRQLMTELAGALSRTGLVPGAILTSPLVRASQSAAILAERLDVPDRLFVDRRLEPGFGPKQLLKIMRSYSHCESILLVGQEPDLSETITKLVGRTRIVLKKGGLAQVEVPDITVPQGRLVGLLSPAMLTDSSSEK